ncbi:MAG: hypothetical protein M1460_01435 [Candidatus Thermoplasmatota archaeon]|nr:hypothetical protein [Candidatus Thermoplasmatota archaeon]MCL5987388.1 hypothetical protein [Candidatus Thermoplasmatota archaeon]
MKKIARNGHVAPIPNDRAAEAKDAAQKSPVYPDKLDTLVNLNDQQIK